MFQRIVWAHQPILKVVRSPDEQEYFCCSLAKDHQLASINAFLSYSNAKNIAKKW